MFTFSEVAKAFVNQKNCYPSLIKGVYVPESVKKAILPINVFADEVSDMYGLTTYFNCNGKWFKSYSKEVHYMYQCVFRELLMKVPMVPAHRNVRTPQGKNEWILCGMIAAKFGAKKLF
jgi:hypothetical protein